MNKPQPANDATTVEHFLTRTCPIDLRPLSPVPMATPSDVAAAVRRARAAQDSWRERSLAERRAPLLRAAKNMLRRRDEIMALVREEMGKLEIEALFNEALGPLDTMKAWADLVERATSRRKVFMNPLKFGGKSAYIDCVPRGVIGVIAPWNYPVSGLYRSLFPALLTGNGVVLKPSEYTPRASGWLVELLSAELPAGLISTVLGDGTVGTALIDAGIDALVFTGSPRAGQQVAVRCAERGIPSSIEMGGKDAAIVLADCDLDRTVAGLTHWALSNVGQACGAIEIAYVEAPIADQLVERLGRSWNRLRMGPHGCADIAPLSTRQQFELVCAQVEDARARGATVVCGGAPAGHGLFYQPTVLDHCTDQMAVVRDETFGPVLAVIRVEGPAEAVRRINRARYGLGASIWTRDLQRAEQLAGRLNVGVVDINNHAYTGAIPELPWSGTRETGFGIANSAFSLGTFVRPRAVTIDRSTGPEPFWMPFDEALLELGHILSDAQLFRLGSAWRLPVLMRERLSAIRAFFRG
jgi:acyl-CoA reductase-like NAD-dependent aldehyde dehydrogenase